MVADDPILMSGAGAFNVRELARELGPERTAALVRAVMLEVPGKWEFAPGVTLDAARRLAAPEPAPQWPERVWALFRRDTGDWGGCTVADPVVTAPGWLAVPVHLLPLDGSRVVLTREEAVAAKDVLVMRSGSSASLAYQGLRHGLAEADNAASAAGG